MARPAILRARNKDAFATEMTIISTACSDASFPCCNGICSKGSSSVGEKMDRRCIWFERVVCFLSVALFACNLVAESLEREIRDSLEESAVIHKNFAAQCKLRRERTLSNGTQEVHDRSFEFRRLENQMRYSRQALKGGRLERVLVSTEQLSFDVDFLANGEELIKYISPRRGVGFPNIRQAILFEAELYPSFWSFNYDSYADMLNEGRMIVDWSSKPVGETVVCSISKMLPLKEVRHPDSTLLRYEGRIGFRRHPKWCVDFIELRTVYPPGDTTGDMWIAGKFNYISQNDNTMPMLKSAVWEQKSSLDGPTFARRTLDVKEVKFGVCHPDDFTLAGCGVKTINTAGAYSNIPLLAWYGGAVFVLCLVGLWLIRKRQRSAA